MIVDGVDLQTRTPNGGYGKMIKIVNTITQMHDSLAGHTIWRIFVDDKNCEFYEVDLSPDVGEGWNVLFSYEIREAFRKHGGYNGLVIRSGQVELMNEDPWWDEPEYRAAANDP